MSILEELNVDTKKLKEYLSISAKAYTGKTPYETFKARDQMAVAQFHVQLMILDRLDKIANLLASE